MLQGPVCVWTMSRPDAEADFPCCVDSWSGTSVAHPATTLGS
jgi:hypothetical protein